MKDHDELFVSAPLQGTVFRSYDGQLFHNSGQGRFADKSSRIPNSEIENFQGSRTFRKVLDGIAGRTISGETLTLLS
jgi:hypothetical protein